LTCAVIGLASFRQREWVAGSGGFVAWQSRP
jgi:hypothetical protein